MRKCASHVICLLGTIVAMMLVPGAVVLASPVAEEHPALTNNTWEVIAHRGGRGLRPENTMTAFRHAVEIGVDVLEFDVWRSLDGELVVIHDDTVDRTTNGTGTVTEMTVEEIQALDAGYHWEPSGEPGTYPFRETGIRIPRLEEVFQAFPHMPMVIEIKQADPPVVDEFGTMLRRYGRAPNTIVGSFHVQVMEDFREKFPEFATSGVEPEIKRFFTLNALFLGRLFSSPIQAFQVPETFGNLRVVSPRFIRVAKAKGVAIQVWTINEPEDMARLLAMGADGIMTDRPDLLLEILDR